jgi:hypothetical protein
MRRIAAALVLGLVLALPVRPVAGESGEATILWPAGDGSIFRVALSRGALAGFLLQREAALEAERARLADRIAEAVEVELALLFNGMMGQLPSYADWAYGWLDSYVAAYFILGRVAESQLTADRPAIGTALRNAMQGVVTEQFEALVLAPALPPAALAAAAARLQALFDTGWAESLVEEQRAWDRLLAREARVLGHQVGLATAYSPVAACPGLTGSMADRSVAPNLSQLAAPDQTGLFALRFIRPFAARGAILVARFGLASGPATEGLFDILVRPSLAAIRGLAATTVLLWTGDYLLNRIDSLLHRGGFEDQLIMLLAGLRQQETERLRQELGAALDIAHAARLRCGPGTAIANP